MIAGSCFLLKSKPIEIVLTFRPLGISKAESGLFTGEELNHKQSWVVDQGPVPEYLSQSDLTLSDGRHQYRIKIRSDGQEFPLIIEDQISILLITIHSDLPIITKWKSPASSGAQDMSIWPELAVILK
jgi:hypothetical protein